MVSLKRFGRFILIFMLLVPHVTASGLGKDKKKQKERQRRQEYYRVKKVKEVVVTATMTPRALKDRAASVTLLTGRDIETAHGTNALDILGNTAGIFVNRSGDFGRADLEIRGLGQNCRRVAVLVDGKPEKMGLFGCAVSHAFPLDNVARIEVVKGPASVLYGGEALGGAVNIITHTPVEKFETDITALYGSYNTQQYNLKHGGNLERFKYFVTFDRRTSDGHVENSDYSGYSFTGKLVYQPSENTGLSFLGKYFDGRKHEPGTIDAPVTGLWNDYRRGSVDLSFKHKWSENRLSLKAYRNFGRHQFSDGWDSRDHTTGVMALFTTGLFPHNELTVGGDYRDFGGTSYGFPVGQWDKREGSVFIRDEYVYKDKWIFSAGLRLQLDSLFGVELCPNAGLVFHASGKTLFRARVSKGFRSPQINELYMFPPANPDLEPERVWNIELGMEQDIGDWLVLKWSVYHMKGTNLIRTIPNLAPPPRFVFANSGEFNFNGAELQAEMYIGKYVSSRVSFSFLDPGEYTRGKPGQKLDAVVAFRKKRFLLSLQGQVVTGYYGADNRENRIPSYFLLSSRMAAPVLKGLDLVVEVNNVFNQNYVLFGEFPGLSAGLYRMPGRNFRVGFRYKR